MGWLHYSRCYSNMWHRSHARVLVELKIAGATTCCLWRAAFNSCAGCTRQMVRFTSHPEPTITVISYYLCSTIIILTRMTIQTSAVCTVASATAYYLVKFAISLYTKLPQEALVSRQPLSAPVIRHLATKCICSLMFVTNTNV